MRVPTGVPDRRGRGRVRGGWGWGFLWKIREKGKGVGRVGTGKGTGKSMRKLCRNDALANYPLANSPNSWQFRRRNSRVLKEGCFEQGVVLRHFISWFRGFLEVLECMAFLRGLFSMFHLMVAMVSVISWF